MLAAMFSTWSVEEQERFSLEFENRKRDLQRGLESAGLFAQMSEAERRFFAASLLERTDQQHIDSAWAMESLACCLWALELLPDLPEYDSQAAEGVLELVPKSGDWPELHLRPTQQLEQARAVAELWHWRSRTRQLAESGAPLPSLPDNVSLDGIVTMAAARASEAGDIPLPVNGDFPAYGKAYRDLSDEEYASVTSIARERHRALNWICGRAKDNLWDETPTDT